MLTVLMIFCATGAVFLIGLGPTPNTGNCGNLGNTARTGTRQCGHTDSFVA
ncbi:MAG TPA: hypothetical protein VFE61_29425 [Candidatus Sulfotelmatobacter sp.]|jgi:hypothetical protein|nr:hypothetical protein [Candidatus Sulfotelmatobacter sp.]